MTSLQLQAYEGGCLLEIRVQPGARRPGIDLRSDGALRVRVAAPAVDGKANQAVVRFLARDLLGLARTHVRIQKGERGRNKVIWIGAEPDWVLKRLLEHGVYKALD